MQILLIGDITGNPDEGMKKISTNLFKLLSINSSIKVYCFTPYLVLQHFKSIFNYKPDIIHYIHGPSTRSVLFGFLLKRIFWNSKIIYSITHPKMYSLSWWLFAKLAPNMVFSSNKEHHQFCKKFGINSKIMPLSGVDLSLFHPVSYEKKIFLRNKLGLPKNKTLILHVGHLRFNRNLLSLIKVQHNLFKQVVILGSTTMNADRNLIGALKNAGCIVHNNFIKDVHEYYQAADCYVFPTFDPNEAISIPLSILEAMATNLPIICTRYCGLHYLFKSGNGIHFIDKKDLPNIVCIINDLISLHDIKCREQVLSYDWNLIAQKLLNQYKTLLSY